jgi:hypothetical protein
MVDCVELVDQDTMRPNDAVGADPLRLLLHARLGFYWGCLLAAEW